MYLGVVEKHSEKTFFYVGSTLVQSLEVGRGGGLEPVEFFERTS
jgi:hypothetical protein